MKAFGLLMSLFSLYSNSYSQDYRRTNRETFEKSGYELVAFNHDSWLMFKHIKKENELVYVNMIDIYDDHYLIERNIVNCKNKTTKAIDQFESINGSKEIRYVVDSDFEKFDFNTVQHTLFQFACRKN